MNTNTSVNQNRKSDVTKGLARRLLQLLITMLIVGVCLFASSGSLKWSWGWVFTGLYAGLIAAGMVLALLVPDVAELAAERSETKENTKGWDKPLSFIVALGGPMLVWIVSGLDERFGWSQISPPLHVIGAVVMVLGYGLSVWAALSNKFYSGTVRIQEERGHTVQTGGPYRFVRHPGYVGMTIAIMAMPVILGSLWGLIPAGLTVCLLVARTALEDKTLREELGGYAEYAHQVRYRLMPGVW